MQIKNIGAAATTLLVVGLTTLTLTLTASSREYGPVVRLSSWNLHNLFDEVDDSYCDKVYTPVQVEQKLDRLAEVVASIDPDLLAVQEVENRALLQRLANRLSGYRTLLVVNGNDKVRGIQVGLMSKQPVTGYRTHRDRVLPGGHRFSRDCLEVHVGGTLPMVVLINHFKSKLQRGNTPSDDLRLAQAQGVSQIVTELENWRSDLKIAVAGDLNDSMRAAPLKPLTGLFDPFGPLPLEEAFTSLHKSKLIVLDHILLNRNLTHNLIPHSASVYHKKAVEKVSDHYPVTVELSP